MMATVFKGTRRTAGQLHRFVVLPEVHRALDAMQALTALANAGAGTSVPGLLFRSFANKVMNPTQDLTYSDIISLIRGFDRHIAELATLALDRCTVNADRAEISKRYLPTVKNFPWKATHFRQHLAWFIAVRPFGIIAGMRQYRHAAESIFQGYAGTPNSGFSMEVAQARAEAVERDIVALYAEAQSGKLGGKRGAELERRFNQLAAQVKDLPGRVVDERQMLKMLKGLGRVVYFGVINDCHFKVETALCIKKGGGSGKPQPKLALCDAEGCKNSCWSQKHLPALKTARDEAICARKTRGLSQCQRSALDRGIEKYDRMILAIS